MTSLNYDQCAAQLGRSTGAILLASFVTILLTLQFHSVQFS